MIDYGKFAFAAAPRTGTSWVRSAACAAGLGEHPSTYVHIPTEPSPNRFSVSMVRHPCDWLLSYWHSLKGGVIGVKSVDMFAKCCWDSTFDLFIRRYVAMMPGEVGRMFFSYQADSYLKTEDLPWAFDELLGMVGVSEALRTKARTLGPQNTTNKIRACWHPSLRQRVLDAEREMIEHFDY